MDGRWTKKYQRCRGTVAAWVPTAVSGVICGETKLRCGDKMFHPPEQTKRNEVFLESFYSLSHST